MALVLGIIFGLILWLGNLKPDHYRNPRAKKRQKVTTKATVDRGIIIDLEELVLIDDFEEEIFEEEDDEGM